MELVIGGVNNIALIDTGACRSMMRSDKWRTVCKKTGRMPGIRVGVQLKSLSGHVIKSKGIGTVEVEGKLFDVHIVEEMDHDMLVGNDILEGLNAVVDYEKGIVKLGQNQHPHLQRRGGDEEMAGAYSEIDYWKKQFPKVFPGKEAPITTTDILTMSIDTGDAMPIKQRAYRVPLTKRRIISQEIDKMLAEGIIRPSASPWASPLTLVPKPDGSVRVCADYRQLNSVTKKDAYPLPQIQDIFDSLEGAVIFTTLDLRSGYWQVGMDRGSIEKTAITCHRGLFEFTRCQFGLANAPAMFQRMMNAVISKFLGKTAMVYLDDVVIYSKRIEDHEQHVAEVLQAFEDHGLTAKETKCHFGLKEVKLLGYIVSAEGLRPCPEKVEAIRDMAPPTNVKGVRRLLGMTGYYRSLIPGYATIARPLTELTKRFRPFVWTDVCNQSWEALRDALIKDVVLAYPRPDQPYRLYTDASDWCVGAILVQSDDNGIERPITYISKQLSETQQRYPTVEKEAFAVIYALTKLRPYLQGAEFVIITDHKPLKSLFLAEINNTRIQRWAVLLAEYAAPIEYRKGANNVRADFLSRLKPVTPHPPPVLEAGMAAFCELEGTPWEFDALEPDALAQEQRGMPEYELGGMLEDEYILHGDLLYTLKPPPGRPEYPRLVLPPSARERVMKRAHQEVCHQGMRKTLTRIQERYKWAGMRKEVYVFLTKCPKCAVNKQKKERPPPTPMPVAQNMGDIIALDMCGPFPISPAGNKYILTMIDHATGFVEAKPLPRKTAVLVADYVRNELVARYGVPSVCIMDNGGEFRNPLVSGYLKEAGVDVRHTAPYHPQSNGRLERQHRTLKDMLRKLVNARATEWEEHLGTALYALRTGISDVSGFSPYYLMYAHHPPPNHRTLYQRETGLNDELVAQRVDELSVALREAAENTEKSRAHNEERATQRTNAGHLEVGDKVLVRAMETGPLDPYWDYGFIVVRIRGSVITVVGPNNKRRTVNRERIRLVEAGGDWEGMRARLTRTQRSTLYQRKGLGRAQECRELSRSSQAETPPQRNAPRKRRRRTQTILECTNPPQSTDEDLPGPTPPGTNNATPPETNNTTPMETNDMPPRETVNTPPRDISRDPAASTQHTPMHQELQANTPPDQKLRHSGWSRKRTTDTTPPAPRRITRSWTRTAEEAQKGRFQDLVPDNETSQAEKRLCVAAVGLWCK